MQENGVENEVGGIQPNGPTQKAEDKINVNGKQQNVEPTNSQKKKCGC